MKTYKFYIGIETYNGLDLNGQIESSCLTNFDCVEEQARIE